MKKIILFMLVLVSVTFSCNAYAQESSPFASFEGIVVSSFPCTCTAGTVWAVIFTSFQSRIAFGAGILSYLPVNPVPPPIAFTAPNYLNLLPGAWNLGDFEIGTQACWVGTPPICVPVPTLGTIQKVGSSWAIK